jgi:hypothetical protein
LSNIQPKAINKIYRNINALIHLPTIIIPGGTCPLVHLTVWDWWIALTCHLQEPCWDPKTCKIRLPFTVTTWNPTNVQDTKSQRQARRILVKWNPVGNETSEGVFGWPWLASVQKTVITVTTKTVNGPTRELGHLARSTRSHWHRQNGQLQLMSWYVVVFIRYKKKLL